MKKLMIVVLLALFASACGGSDASSDVAGTTDPAEQAADDGTDSADDGGDAADEETIDAPDPLLASTIESRDCAHSAAELATDEEPVEEEVVLPPAEKPPVDDEYLVAVDELITTDLIEGTGAVATAGLDIEMQYVGVLASDGTQFDASWDRVGQPFSFTLGSGQVIAGWDEGIEGMKVGGRRVLQIPSAKAYGEQARGDIIGANADLVFIVDLIGIAEGSEPAPPIDDANLGSFADLQISDLVVGQGCTAEVGDIVFVNYVGVDADTGEEFDSSWGRGAVFPLIVGRSQVIDGWNAGIEGMNVGGERILQIPSGQAYGEGDLVFRVHLEELFEAPLAHTLEFDGTAPIELEIETLVEGVGDAAGADDIVDLNIAVMLWNSGSIIESTWLNQSPTQIVLGAGTLLPGLAEGIEGAKVGEVRQIVIPTNVAYPGGVPEGAGFEPGDAIVFIIAPLRVTAS